MLRFAAIRFDKTPELTRCEKLDRFAAIFADIPLELIR